MATTKVVDLLNRALTQLLDSDAIRWSRLELQGWLNDGYREAVILKPDCYTRTGTFVCAAGPRQVLGDTFPEAVRLIDVVRNVATSSAHGAVLLTDRRSLDTQRRSWYGDAQSVDIELFMFDPRLPKEFLVYPPATTAARLEVIYASVPAPHTLTDGQLADTNTSETLRLDDSYANALLDYVLYRAFAKDSENQSNAARAVAYYGSFKSALGDTAAAAAASQPGVA